MTTETMNVLEVTGYDPSYDDGIEALCHQFVDESLGEYGLTVTRDRVDQMIELCKGYAFFLVSDGVPVGVIAGMLVANFTNGKPALQEIVWYVNKDYRSNGKLLLNAFEDLGKSMKLSAIVMGLMVNSRADTLDKMYQRMGYRKFEVQYIKEL